MGIRSAVQFAKDRLSRVRRHAPPWLERELGRYPIVQIYVRPDCRADAGRIALSAGTRPADEREVGELGYDRGAILPREPWRHPTRDEGSLLVTDAAPQPQTMARSVCIMRLPGFSSDISETVARNEKEPIRDNIVRPLAELCEFGEPLHVIGLHRGRPNLKTVTVDHETGKSTGLHVDSWDKLQLRYRDQASNRICVNIGRVERYFLFIPFSVIEIERILSDERAGELEDSRRQEYTGIERIFAEHFPDVPVVRCRLAPGEAYIAPTENLVHDGSSVGTHEPDLNFTIRGHIRLLDRPEAQRNQ